MPIRKNLIKHQRANILIPTTFNRTHPLQEDIHCTMTVIAIDTTANDPADNSTNDPAPPLIPERNSEHLLEVLDSLQDGLPDTPVRNSEQLIEMLVADNRKLMAIALEEKERSKKAEEETQKLRNSLLAISLQNLHSFRELQKENKDLKLQLAKLQGSAEETQQDAVEETHPAVVEETHLDEVEEFRRKYKDLLKPSWIGF